EALSAAAGLPPREDALEARRVYEAAHRVRQRVSKFFQEGSKEREDLESILTDRRYFHDVDGVRRAFFDLRDRLNTIIEAVAARMEVEMEDENLDSLTGDSLLVVVNETSQA